MHCRHGFLIAALLAAPLDALAQQVRASALLGAAVDQADGENIGYITDLAIDLKRRQVHYAMLYANARSAVGQQVYGVPLSGLRPAVLRDHLVFDPAAAGGLPPPPQDAQLVRASRLIGENIADLVVDLESGEVTHLLVEARDGSMLASPLEVLDPALELRGTIIERGLVPTPDGMRQTAKLKTPEGRIVSLDLGPPGGEGSIAPGESVVLAAHPGQLDGKPVLVVDVIMERLPATR